MRALGRLGVGLLIAGIGVGGSFVALRRAVPGTPVRAATASATDSPATEHKSFLDDPATLQRVGSLLAQMGVQGILEHERHKVLLNPLGRNITAEQCRAVADRVAQKMAVLCDMVQYINEFRETVTRELIAEGKGGSFPVSEWNIRKPPAPDEGYFGSFQDGDLIRYVLVTPGMHREYDAMMTQLAEATRAIVLEIREDVLRQQVLIPRQTPRLKGS